MSEVMRVNIIDIDLSKPLRTEQHGILIASYDNYANAFGVNVLRNGARVNLSGCTVMGYFTGSDGKTFKLKGKYKSNQAYVVLTRECYLKQGRFRLAVTISDGTVNTTVRIIYGFMLVTMSEELWTPDDSGGDVPDIPDTPVAPDMPSAVTFTVDANGAATITGATLTVDANGNATLTGATLTVNASGAAKVA